MKKYLIAMAIAMTAHFSHNKANAQTISTIAGNGTPGYSGDGGAATAGRMRRNGQLVSDASGNLFVAELQNHVIRKISPSGIISTVAGTGFAGYSGDGGPATLAQLNTPYGIAVDRFGNLYIGDAFNQRVRKVSPAGIISTIAGTGIGAYSGDGGAATAAKLWNPGFLHVDTFGAVYVCDNQNQRIRKIDPAGIITTIAGTGISGYTGDSGPATLARLSYPNGIWVTNSGIILIGDANNNVVRKIDLAGVITTIAGTGLAAYGGDGGPATTAFLNVPENLYVDNAGNILFTDAYNHRVRKITPAGIITTIAGIGTAGYSGDGGPATAAQLNIPDGVCMDNLGRICIAEAANHTVRRMGPNNNIPTFTTGAVGTLALCVDELPTSINSLLAVSDLDAGQTLTWSVVTAPSHGTLSASYSATSTGGVITPTGTTYMPTAGYTGTDMFKVQVFDGIAYDTITINVTVSDVPSPGVILGTDSVCVGSSITLTATAGGGVWTYVTGAAFVSSGIVTGVTPGVDTVVYTVTNSCGSATAKRAIKVLPYPDAGVISGVDSVCVGSVISLSESVTGGVWGHFVTGISTVSSSGVVTGVAGGIDTIAYSVANVCGTASATFPIKVLPLANAGVISGIDSVCPGQTITLSETVTGGVWGQVVSGVTTVSTTGIVSGLTTGVDTIEYTVTNVCGPAKAKYVVKVLSVNFCHKLSAEGVIGNREDCIVYPNPSNGRFSILVSSPVSKNMTVTITDIAGRRLKEFTVSANASAEFSTNMLPGIYILNVASDQGVISKKIIITPQ